MSGTRRNRRKTHLVDVRIKHGLTDTLQPEVEVTYHAYRQHTHSDGDAHDRNDDGDFERIFAGLSYQAIRDSKSRPDVRLRGGVIFPNRAEDEGIGQEAGFELLAATTMPVDDVQLTGTVGLAMTFDNHDQPADPVFTTPRSKGHDLRTFTYGIGLTEDTGHVGIAVRTGLRF